jgi:hypothetical protein
MDQEYDTQRMVIGTLKIDDYICSVLMIISVLYYSGLKSASLTTPL